jgi:putative transposase
MRAHALRYVFDAIFYVLSNGCPWRMLPGDFLPWSNRLLSLPQVPPERPVALHRQGPACGREEKGTGKDPQPTAAILDSQSMKTTEEDA